LSNLTTYKDIIGCKLQAINFCGFVINNITLNQVICVTFDILLN